MISSEPANSADRTQEFVLYSIDQDDRHLVGTWSYTNGAVGNETPPRINVEGTTTADGTFWPKVKLEVRKGRTGKWKQVANPSIEGERATVSIEPKAINFDLTVNLDAFKPLIGKYEDGRIVLTTGRASVFELKDLLPPEPAEPKNDSTKPAQSNADLNAPEQDTRPPSPGVTSIPARTVALVNSTAGARLGSSINDFLSLWGPPIREEVLDRTARIVWDPPSKNNEKLSKAIFEAEVSFLDRIACEIVLRSKHPLKEARVAKLAKTLVPDFRTSDLATLKSENHGGITYTLSSGGYITAWPTEKPAVVVIRSALFLRNNELFDREAARVRPPTSDH